MLDQPIVRKNSRSNKNSGIKSSSRVKFSTNVVQYPDESESNLRDKNLSAQEKHREHLFLDTPIFGFAPLIYRDAGSSWKKIQSAITSPFKQDFKKLL
jgi:hypothetical protein